MTLPDRQHYSPLWDGEEPPVKPSHYSPFYDEGDPPEPEPYDWDDDDE